jgi:hypothetical protein
MTFATLINQNFLVDFLKISHTVPARSTAGNIAVRWRNSGTSGTCHPCGFAVASRTTNQTVQFDFLSN